MREDRLRNLKLIIQLQNTINSRIAETLSELLRNKDSSGKEEIMRLIESVNYKMEDELRFVSEDN